MKALINLSFVLSLMSITLGCSLDVKKAYAPTDPPKIDNIKFDARNIDGVFSRFEGGKFRVGVAPKMFLWPQRKIDEQTNSFVPMSFDEQVEARKNITAAADDLADFEKQMETAESALVAKYDNLKASAVSFWSQNSCYSFCSESAFFCDPSDQDNFEIDADDWVCVPEEMAHAGCLDDPQSEKETICAEEPPAGEQKPAFCDEVSPDPVQVCSLKQQVADTCRIKYPKDDPILVACQVNQEDRQNFDSLQSDEFEISVRPLQEKAGSAALELLQTVGDENYFGDLKRFSFYNGAISCTAELGDCLSAEKQNNTFVVVEWGDFVLTNFLGNQDEFKISDVKIDQVDGFMAFKMPAIDVNNGNKVYGEFTFDLEFVQDGDRLQVNGDIRLFDFASKKESVGRFASSGNMRPLSSQD